MQRCLAPRGITQNGQFFAVAREGCRIEVKRGKLARVWIDVAEWKAQDLKLFLKLCLAEFLGVSHDFFLFARNPKHVSALGAMHFCDENRVVPGPGRAEHAGA